MEGWTQLVAPVLFTSIAMITMAFIISVTIDLINEHFKEKYRSEINAEWSRNLYLIWGESSDYR